MHGKCKIPSSSPMMGEVGGEREGVSTGATPPLSNITGGQDAARVPKMASSSS